MFYRCIRFNTNQYIFKLGTQTQNEQKGLECAVVWRTGLSGAPGPYRVKPATLGKTQARSAIIHRTVRCASRQRLSESRLEGGGVNRANLKFTKLITTTTRVSVRNIIESEREGAKQIASE
jgi:hypothetical protein